MIVEADVYFAIIPEWVLYAPITATSVRLYGALRRYADREGVAHPSRRTLASRLSCSKDTIDRGLKELESIGAITIHERPRDEDRNDTNVYQLHSTPRGEGTVPVVRPVGRKNAAQVVGTNAAQVGGKNAAQNQRSKNQSQKEPEKYLEAAAPAAAPVRKLRAVDPLWDALATALGRQPATTSERGRWNRALKELRDIAATAEQLEAACVEHSRRWPGCELTPTSIAANWSSLLTPSTRAAPAPRGFAGVEEFMRRRGLDDRA